MQLDARIRLLLSWSTTYDVIDLARLDRVAAVRSASNRSGRSKSRTLRRRPASCTSKFRSFTCDSIHSFPYQRKSTRIKFKTIGVTVYVITVECINIFPVHYILFIDFREWMNHFIGQNPKGHAGPTTLTCAHVHNNDCKLWAYSWAHKNI